MDLDLVQGVVYPRVPLRGGYETRQTRSASAVQRSAALMYFFTMNP